VVATTRNKENAERLYLIGADDVVIDDGCISEKVRNIYPQGVDCALEIVGAPTVTDTLQTVKHWGQVCVIGLLCQLPREKITYILRIYLDCRQNRCL